MKEANAQSVRLQSLTTTLADEYARMGLDWETQLRQRAKELELIAELGITSSPSVTPEEEDEDEADEDEHEVAESAAAA